MMRRNWKVPRILGIRKPAASNLFYLTFQLGRERINVIIKGAETGEYR